MLKSYNFLALSVIMIIITCSTFSRAGFIEWSNAIQSNSGISTVEIGQPSAIDSVAAFLPVETFQDVQVLNRISFGIDFHYSEYFGSNMDVDITVLVKRWDASFNPMADTTISLSIAYNPFDTTQTIALNKVEFSNAYKLVFSVESIIVNGNNETILPGNLYVQGDIFIERYVQLSSSTVAFSGLTSLDMDCDSVTDGIKISWSAVTGAEEYQLEWTFITNYGQTGLIAPTNLPFDFKYNSTRITTAALNYKIALLFDRGWLVYRIRPVGVDLANPTQFIFGDWNLAQTGNVGAAPALHKFEITSAIQHEADINWQYSATYAEQGKKKEIVSYYDGSLRNRQTVTKINSDENVIVGETIYDHQGRPAINVLPTPVPDVCAGPEQEPTIHLYRDFNQNTSNEAYSRLDFDLSDPGQCNSGAAPMDPSSGSSNYYSSSNTNQNLEQAYVPDANQFPFTQVEYTPDNTGRIRRQGGVGPEFQLDSNHETKYLYGKPNQLELDRLFGSEVGNELHYKKNVVIDAHGQASISYLDQEGRVIATSLAGDAPANLTGIESEAANAVGFEIDAFGNNNELNKLSIDNDALVYSTALTVAYQSTYTVAYDFEVPPLDIECLENICVDCVYDLTIEVVDECGENLAPVALEHKMIGKFTVNNGVVSFHSACVSPEEFSFDTTFNVSLAPGSYMLNKRLTVNMDALDAFVQLYLDSASNCAMTLDDFEDIAMSNIDTSDCAINCDDCFQSLGTLEDFIANGEGSANDYYLHIEQCEQICSGTYTQCDIMETLLQMDLSPGGQYGEYLNPNTGAYAPNSFPLSFYNSSNALVTSGTWKDPILLTPTGAKYIYADDNGDTSRVYLIDNPSSPGTWSPLPEAGTTIKIDAFSGESYIYPEELANLSDFIDAFEMSWGKSLISYHPEFCYYETCLSFEEEVNQIDAFTSLSFDQLLTKINTFQEAQNEGLINGSGIPTNWFSPVGGDPTNSSIPWDPYVYYSSAFSEAPCDGLGIELMQLFNQYKLVDGQWYSMPEIAAYTARCGTNFVPNPPASCFEFGQLYNGVVNQTILDQEWVILRSLYLSEKQKLQREYADCKALKVCNSYNGCIGNESFNPFINMGVQGGGFFGLPGLSLLQPCRMFTAFLYKYKVKRFSNEDDIPEQDANGVAYEIYLQTGQCPVPFALQHLLDEIANDDELVGTAVDLNNYAHLMSLYIADNNFAMPGTIPDLEYNGSVSGNVLTATWTDVSNSSLLLTMTMSIGGGAIWTDVTNIVNLYATSGNTFTAEAVLNGAVYPVTGSISGTTQFILDPCYFEFECSSNQLALDLTVLLNALHLDGEITSTSDIQLNPYSNSFGSFGDITNIYIENAANVGSNLYWVSINSNLYKIYDPSGTVANGLYLNFNSALTPSFLATVSYFGNITSTGQYSFEVEAFLTAGGSVILEGSLYRETNSDILGIATGDCGLPVPAACQTVPHYNYTDLQNLLNDVLVVQDYDGISQIDLFTSIAFTPNLKSSLPAGATITTSNLNGTNDILTISAEGCDLTLEIDPSSSAEIQDLIEIQDFMITGVVDNYNNYHDFEFTGTFFDGSNTLYATVFGTSCLPIKECSPCGVNAWDTINEENIQAYITNQVQKGAMIFDDSKAMTGNALDISNYLKKTYTSTPFITRKEPVANQVKVFDPCKEVYSDYFNCIDNYNGTGPQFPVTNVYSYEDFTTNGWCECTTEFCRRLNQVLNEEVGFKSEEEFLAFIDFDLFCGCESAYQNYFDCFYTYYYSSGDYSIGEIIKYEDFVANGWCQCADIFCYRINQVMNEEVSFGSQEEFTDFLDFNLFCNDCGIAYQIYLNCVEDYNLSKPQYPIRTVIGYEEFEDKGWCDCVDQFCDLLNTIIVEQIQFDSEQDFLNYIDFNVICDGCSTEYQEYEDCYYALSNIHMAYTMPRLVSYEDFMTNGWCECAGVFCYRVNQFITQEVVLNDQTEFDAFFDFNEFCNDCNVAYLQYLDCVENYNNSRPQFSIRGIIKLENFIANGWCDCVDEFCDLLNTILLDNIVFDSEEDFLTYIDFNVFCDDVSIFDPQDPCGDKYLEYLDCIANYNANTSSYIVNTFVSEEDFNSKHLCTCVDQFCAALQSVLLEIETFDSQKEFNLFLFNSIHCESTPPCQPEPTTGIPTVMPSIDLENECVTMLINQAMFEAQNNYNNYVDSISTILVQQYMDHCLSPLENMTYSYMDKSYHYTLYYYDQAGNLIKTIPPAGVEVLDITSSSNPLAIQIAQDRTNHTKTVFTSHRLPTIYEYNSLNQLVTQSTPDTDPMDLFESNLPNGLNSQLITRRIQMIDASRGYLGGEVNGRGYLYQTTDAGNTWSRVYNLVAADFKKVLMFDANNGIALGEKGIVVRTTNGGQTWDMINTWSTSSMIFDLNDAAFNDLGGGNYELLLVGEEKCVAFCSNILAPSPTFTINASGIAGSTNTSISSVVADGTTFFVTANDNTSNQAAIYEYNSTGSSWDPSSGFVENSFTDIQYYSASGAYSAGVDGRLYKNPQVLTSGSTWLHVQSDLKDPIQSIRFFDENQGVAIVEQNGDGYLFRTTNGGTNWTQISEEKFNNLSISKDLSLILAVGQNSALEVVVPFNGSGVQNILIAAPANGMNFTAGWIDTETNGQGNTNAHIIISNDAGTLYYTPNAFMTYPNWNTTSIGSDVVNEIVAERGWTSNQTIYGAITTTAGSLKRLKKESTDAAVSILNFSGVGASPHKSLAYDGTKIFSTYNNGVSLVSIPMSAATTGYSAVGTFSVPINDIVTKGTKVNGVSSSGEMMLITLNGTYTAFTGQSVETNYTAPNKLHSIGYNATSNRYIATGEDGMMYLRDNSLNTWNRLNTSTNETIYDYDEDNFDVYAVGSNGYSKYGNVIYPNFNSQDFLIAGGISVQSILGTKSLHAVDVSSYTVYAVGENGKVVYNQNAFGGSYSVHNQGTQDLYDVCFKPTLTSALIVGNNATILENNGASFMIKKEVYTPAIIDLNFNNSLSGTVLCEDFVIRKTANGCTDFKVVRPSGLVAPTNSYRKVWNTNQTTAYVFGDIVQYKITNEIAAPLTINVDPVDNVRAVEQGSNSNILHLVNNEDVMTLNLTTNDATNIVSLGSGALANDIHVFANGDYLVVGENALYKHYSATNTVLESSNASFAGEDFNDIDFKDNINGAIVGDNGTYYFAKNQAVSTAGYFTTTQWQQRSILFTADPIGVTSANVYSLAFASATATVIGGEDFGTYSTPYVRAIYDAGLRYSARFFYDKLGRLVVSQNARQYNGLDRKFSYTLYDELGRVVEVGEKTENSSATARFNSVFGTTVSGFYNPRVIDDTKLLAWVEETGARREVTKSYYDETVIAGLPGVMAMDLSTQRKRIIHVTYEELYDGDDQTYDHGTHYKYDIHGNVKTMLQDNRKMVNEYPSLASQELKRMDYAYDLVSGNVHRMSVQDGEIDQWHHAYKYDADNRIIDAYTNAESPFIAINSAFPQDMENELMANSDWQKDASYYYYDHGPLARTEIGENLLQGVDYVYNLQGWLKGVNSSVLDYDKDPGQDSKDGTTNQFFAKDVMGFGLHYYTGDYTAINGTGQNHLASVNSSSHPANNSFDLYNGNIRYMQTAITNPTTHAVMPMLNAYKYDQLNRLLESRSYESGLSSNVWNSTTYSNNYFNQFEYDAMGNIQTQKRHTQNGTAIEELSYKYQLDGNGKLIRNRLYHLDDAIGAGVDATDIDDMGVFEDDPNLINTNNNYSYDEEGRLIKDLQEEIDLIVWRVDGKVKEIIRPTTSQKKNVSFDYDAMGNRIAKHVMDPSTLILEKSTYYILDAQGNTMSTYDHIVDNSTTYYTLKERQIYGSSRLGMHTAEVDMFNPTPQPSTGILGLRYYELSNHLGNVLAVINDEITPLDEDLNTYTDAYQVGIVNVSDYSPFGVQLDGRTISNGDYRYGFQGQEKDDEVKGEGNSVNYKYRMHDPRIGRFFAVDPLIRYYPHYSSYGFSGNVVIHNIELEGLENIHYLELKDDGTWGAVKIDGKDWIDVNNDLDENVNCYMYYWSNGGSVKTSVYKSHQQGGKDRWEYKGGLAPPDLMRAHYEHDKGSPSNSTNSNNRLNKKWYESGGDGPILGAVRFFLGDETAKKVIEYDARLSRQDGFTKGGGWQLMVGTAIFVVTAGQATNFVAAGGSLTSGEGLWLSFELVQGADGILNLSSLLPEEVQTIWKASGFLSDSAGLLNLVKTVKFEGKTLEFFDKVGAPLGVYEVVDGAYQLVN